MTNPTACRVLCALEFFYFYLRKVGNLLQPIMLLLFRLHWGWLFFTTGRGKLLNHDHVVTFFTNLGIPAPGFNAWFVGGVECIGGLLLLVGFAARPTALILTVNMLVAYLSVAEDRAALLGIFSDPEPFIAADPFFFFLLSLLVLSFGPGLLSVDAIINHWLRKRAPRTDV